MIIKKLYSNKINLLIKSPNDLFSTADSSRNETFDCGYEWVIDSICLSIQNNSFMNETPPTVCCSDMCSGSVVDLFGTISFGGTRYM